jgi:colanic acid biosynthesis glycosyl transferase WcaI
LSVPSKTYGIMATATPIIGFLNPQSEIGRTLIENNCGIVLDNPTASSVVEVLLQCLNDREHLRMMGRRGYEAFKRNYTLEAAAQRYSNLMSEVF